MRRVFGILLALLAVALTFVWFLLLVEAASDDCLLFSFIACADLWTYTAVSGVIILGIWVGTFALLSGLKRISDERSDS